MRRTISASASFRSKLGDEKLMLRISGAGAGYLVAILLLPSIFFGELGLGYYLILCLVWSGLLFPLLYYARRFGAVTLTFAAITPVLAFLFWFLLPPFEPFMLWWLSVILPLIALEYLTKLALLTFKRA